MKLSKLSLLLAAIVLVGVLICNWWVKGSVEHHVYNDIDKIENRSVALVLGTSRSINGVYENPYFTHRIQAAADLYHNGKVKHILVSGDNGNEHYNEPRDMKTALMAKGVPDSCITMDFAGFRTLDSVVRSKEVFQQDKLIIVSQEFHNYRALFIAEHYGIDAIAYNAKFPSDAKSSIFLREYLARVKVVLDLYLLNKQPKFLGDKIDIRV